MTSILQEGLRRIVGSGPRLEPGHRRATVLAISHQPALTGVANRIYRIADGKCTEIEASDCSDRAAS